MADRPREHPLRVNGAILGMRRAEIDRKFAEIERFLDTTGKASHSIQRHAPGARGGRAPFDTPFGQLGRRLEAETLPEPAEGSCW